MHMYSLIVRMQGIVGEIPFLHILGIYVYCSIIACMAISLYSGEAIEQELRQSIERRRSSTDPIVMTVQTPGDLESKPTHADTGIAHQEHKIEPGIFPPNLTLLRNGAENRGATSLDDVRPMCSTPSTPPSASYSTKSQHRSPFKFSLAQSQSSSTNTSMRSISQSSQDPYSSYSSSNGSHVSSSSSLPQGNITDAVLERTSVMLLHQVTANFPRFNPNNNQLVGDTQFGYQYGQRRSFHEPHVTYAESHQLQRSAQTLPRLNTATPTQPAIQGPTISEIYSDSEDVEKGQTENQSKKRMSQKRMLGGSREGVHEGHDYDDTTLTKQKPSDSPNIERSRTPRLAENPPPDQTDSQDLDVAVAERPPAHAYGRGIHVCITSESVLLLFS